MKETKFIDKNKDKWLSFERLLDLDIQDPDRLSDFFIQITDDLSYSRTFYSNRSIRVYLNNVCQQLFYSIYKNKKSNKIGFSSFWTRKLPQIIFESRKELLTSFIVFLLAVLIGVISAVNDPNFSRVILGEAYVEMTIENIEGGDPMAVYKKMNEVDMFLGITFNNVMVAFKTFVLGIFFTIGSIGILLQNGIMVGVFQYFFIEHDLFIESFLTIWLHGTLEISSIIIAGGAGIVLGKGLIAPGTYSRLQSFQISAKRGLKLLLGTVPIFVIAAMIESFLTRYTDASDYLRLILIALSFICIVSYFIWYPFYLSKQNVFEKTELSDLQPSKKYVFEFEGMIKETSTIMKDIFNYMRMYFKDILKLSALSALIYVPIALFFIYSSVSTHEFNYSDWYTNDLLNFINYSKHNILFPLNLLSISFFSYIFLKRLYKVIKTQAQNKAKGDLTKMLYSVVLTIVLLQVAFFTNTLLGLLISSLLSPILLTVMFVSIYEKSNFGESINRSLGLLKENYGRTYGLFFITLLVSIVCLLFINSPFPLFYLELIRWNIPVEEDTLNLLLILFNSFVSVFGILMVLPFYLLAFAINYFSIKEITEARFLKEEVQLINN